MEIVICGFITPSLFALAGFGTFGSTFRITLFGEGSLMRIHYPKCTYGSYCKLNPIQNGVYIHLRRSLFLYLYVTIMFFKCLSVMQKG